MAVEYDRRSGVDTRPSEIISEQGERRSEADRRALRRRVLKGVKIAFNGEYCAVEGVMKNISETGAFIKLTDGYLIPDHIMIFNELEGYKVPAEVVRREAEQIGVRFTAAAEAIERSRTQVIQMLDSGSSYEMNSQEQSDITQVKSPAQKQKPVFGRLGTAK